MALVQAGFLLLALYLIFSRVNARVNARVMMKKILIKIQMYVRRKHYTRESDQALREWEETKWRSRVAIA